MSTKDIEITTVALMKSIIESGIPKDEWEASVREGCRVFLEVTNKWKSANK